MKTGVTQMNTHLSNGISAIGLSILMLFGSAWASDNNSATGGSALANDDSSASVDTDSSNNSDNIKHAQVHDFNSTKEKEGNNNSKQL